MNKFLKFPLSIQLFAEPGDGGAGGNGGGDPSAQGGTTQIQIDYNKMADAISKRASKTEDNVLVGYLKQQGLSGEELNQAVEAYKTKKQEDAAQEKQARENMLLENQQLKQQIMNSNIDSKVSALAGAEGVSSEKLPFLLKMIEREGLTDDKGEVLEDKVKEALNTVIKAFPEFKGNSQQNEGFRQVGGSGGNSGTSVEDQLDTIFGVGKK